MNDPDRLTSLGIELEVDEAGEEDEEGLDDLGRMMV